MINERLAMSKISKKDKFIHLFESIEPYLRTGSLFCLAGMAEAAPSIEFKLACVIVSFFFLFFLWRDMPASDED